MFVVSQLIIAPAYISDCYSSVVSTSRQLIKAFLFLFLYTWSLVGSSQKKKTPLLLHNSRSIITCCNHSNQAKCVYFHLITCSSLQCGMFFCSVTGRILSLFQNSDPYEGQNGTIGLFVLKIRNPNKGAEVLVLLHKSMTSF